MTETWTLTGSLADFGLDPVAGTSIVVTHDPPVWVDDAGDRLLVREEREPVADDGTFTIELAVTSGNYRVATTPRSLFSPFRFPSPSGGSHALHDLYLTYHGVPVPSPGAPLVKGDPGEPGEPGEPGASVVGGRDNGDGTVSFLLSDGTETDPVTVPPGPAGRGIASVEDADGDGTATITFTDGDTASLPLPPGQDGQPGQDSTVPGPPNALSIGTVTTGPAAASITGEAPDQTLSLVLPAGPQGPAGVSSIDPSSRELVGTGSPEGSVAASPGVYYTDQAGTNGAWRWLKKTGTGTTGWSVIHGDAGWRSIPMTTKSDSDPNISSMTFLIRVTTGGIHVRWTLVATATIGWQLWVPDNTWVQTNVIPGISGTIAKTDSHHLTVSTWESRMSEAIPRKITVKPMSSLIAGTWEGRASAAPPISWPTTTLGTAV